MSLIGGACETVFTIFLGVFFEGLGREGGVLCPVVHCVILGFSVAKIGKKPIVFGAFDDTLVMIKNKKWTWPGLIMYRADNKLTTYVKEYATVHFWLAISCRELITDEQVK